MFKTGEFLRLTQVTIDDTSVLDTKPYTQSLDRIEAPLIKAAVFLYQQQKIGYFKSSPVGIVFPSFPPRAKMAQSPAIQIQKYRPFVLMGGILCNVIAFILFLLPLNRAGCSIPIMIQA